MEEARPSKPNVMDSMTEWKIERFAADKRGVWDAFVKESRNATFLHMRDYMDYHANRFNDHSLMAYKSGKLRGVLPAEVAEDSEGMLTMGSHRGLTYGGWLLPQRHIDGEDVLQIFELWKRYCQTWGISRIDYKPVPYIYHRMPAQEDIYALWRMGATQEGYTISSSIDLESYPGFNSQQQRNAKKFEKRYPVAEVILMEDNEDIAEFYALLSECLGERHEATPVHSLEEILFLRSRFPENIKIYGVRGGGNLMAAVCMYLTDRVAHCQYIASAPEGRECGALAWLFKQIIDRCAGYRYFDFGISNEERGRVLNSGLLRQKSGLGGSGVVYPRFSLLI